MWKTKAGWHSTKKLDLRPFYQEARLKIPLFSERFWFRAYSMKISLALKPKSFGEACNHEIYFHCLRGIGNVNWKVGWERTWSTFVVDRKWYGGEIKLSWKSRQILGRKFPANLHFRASTNVCQFLQIQIYYYTNRITSTWTIIRQLCNSGSQHFFFASLAKNIEEITMIIEYCTKMKMICTYDTLKWFQSALNS